MRRSGFNHWIFDLDNTLYPASCRLFDQVEARMTEFIAGYLELGPDEARRLQKQYFRDHGTTLRGLMVNHDVPPRSFLDYVHAIDVSPIPPAPLLAQALARLPGEKLVYTNGSRMHATNVMTRLGVMESFDGIFDIIDADYLAKPAPESYARLIARHAIDPREAVFFEDIPRNLAPAAALGMTTVLVATDSEWAREGAEGDHIHHVADDLVAWLEAAAQTAAGN